MVRNRSVQVRLTKDQYERVWKNCEMRGFQSLSAFLRFSALEQDFTLLQKVLDIHRHLIGEPPVQRKKRVQGDLPRGF